MEKDVNKAKKQLKQGTKKAGPELNTFVEKVRLGVLSCQAGSILQSGNLRHGGCLTKWKKC